MQRGQCLNCGKSLQAGEKYCSACGQRSDVGRINFYNLFAELLHSITNFEQGLLHLVRDLAKKPGRVVVDYIDGKRKQYYNPFTFLAICLAITFFISTAVNPYKYFPTASRTDIDEMPTERLRTLADLANERSEIITQFVQNYSNFTAIVFTPFMAFGLWLFFRKKKRNIPEISVAYIFLSAFATLVASIFFYPFMLIFYERTEVMIINTIILILQGIYLAWGLKTFFSLRVTGGFFKIAGALAVSSVIGIIILVLILFFYIYSGSFELLYYMGEVEKR